MTEMPLAVFHSAFALEGGTDWRARQNSCNIRVAERKPRKMLQSACEGTNSLFSLWE